jgi:hypothetical protein
MFRKKNDRVILSDILLKRNSNSENRDERPEESKRKGKIVIPALSHKSISKGFVVIILLICCSAIGAFFLTKNKASSSNQQNEAPISDKQNEENNYFERGSYVNNLNAKIKEHETTKSKPNNNSNVLAEADVNKNFVTAASTNSETIEDKSLFKTKYNVKSRAFWYREPSRKAREKKFISRRSSIAPFNALAEQNGFVYASITNNKGQDVEGWLRKRDLRPIKVRIYQSDLK